MQLIRKACKNWGSRSLIQIILQQCRRRGSGERRTLRVRIKRWEQTQAAGGRLSEAGIRKFNKNLL